MKSNPSRTQNVYWSARTRKANAHSFLRRGLSRVNQVPRLVQAGRSTPHLPSMISSILSAMSFATQGGSKATWFILMAMTRHLSLMIVCSQTRITTPWARVKIIYGGSSRLLLRLFLMEIATGNIESWTIQDLGNGNVTLYNMGENKYLATRRVSDTWQPVLSETAPLALVSTGSTQEEENERAPWRIEAISEVSWSVCIWRRTNRAGFRGREKLSLSLKDDTVILKPWKKAHNQIWMIEPTNAPVPTGNRPAPGADDEISPGLSLQQNKAYQFKRNDELGGIRVAYVNPGRYEATFALNSDFTPSQLIMERNPGASGQGEVFIYRSLSGKRYLTLSGPGSQIIVTEDPYSWTIEQAQNKAFFLIRDTKSTLYLSHNTRTGPLTMKSQSGANDTTTFWAITPFN